MKPSTQTTLNNNACGFLIAIEGIDGVGKNTQAKLLHAQLKDHHGDCGFFSFPRYETPTGRRVREYLDGDHGDINILQVATLYADDRLAAREEIYNYLLQGYPVICDRYVTSNRAFQSIRASMMNHGGSYNYPRGVLSYIDHLEHTVYSLPRPNLEIVLTVSPEASQRMMSERYGADETKKDRYEADIELMKRTHDFYANELNFGHEARRRLVECSTPEGGILPVEDIARMVADVAKLAGAFILNND